MRDQTPVGASAPENASMRGRLAVLSHLGPAARAIEQVRLDDLRFVALDRVDGVDAEELLDVVVCQLWCHGCPVSLSMRSVRRRLRPARIRLLMVPSGVSRIVATSRYVYPSK